jgi:ABC-type phosphate/phosphonate transport system substrate-binding protein
MIATLPMYDLPGLRDVTDSWWTGLAGHLRMHGIEAAPDASTRDGTPRDELWRSPDLLLSQTCGYPLVHALGGLVGLIATPRHGAPGCAGALYRSLIVARADAPVDRLADFKAATAAVNATDSHSGWNALRPMTDPLGGWDAVIAKTVISGGHPASIDLVRDGGADLAAIDCVTHALLVDTEPDRLAGTRIIGQSMAAPALPYVAGRNIGPAGLKRIRAALFGAAEDTRPGDGSTQPAHRGLRRNSACRLPIAMGKMD